MTIYECDFCKQQKSCRKLTLDEKEYDICQKCQDKMEKQLLGRGQVKPRPIVWYWPYYNGYYTWPTIQWPVQPTQWPPIVTYTTPATNVGGGHYQMGNVGGSYTNSNCLTLTTSQ